MLFGLCSYLSYAQNSPDAFANRINYIFQNIDKNQIPTGILQEYGIDFTNVNNYSGQVLNDSNVVVLDEWRSLYNSLYSAQVRLDAGLQEFSNIRTAIDANSDNSLVVMHYNFNSIRTDALSSNLLYTSNDQLFDVGGRNQSPYAQETAFAICANNAWYETGNVSFIFRPGMFYSNTGKTVSALYLDAGGGYQQVNWDTPAYFNFDAVGRHKVKAKIVYTDASVYESHFNIYVKSISNAERKGPTSPVLNFTAQPDVPLTATRSFSGPAASGKLQIRISDQNAGVIRKPLIVAEGFDPNGIISGVTNRTINDFLTEISFTGLYGNLELAGYDIIYLDYANGTDYIQNNAYLLQDAIKWVNQNKAPDAAQSVVLGQSMGGLVARWALKDIEDRSESHQVRQNISMDSPHNGAYVPLAAQALIKSTDDFKISAGLVGLPLVTLFEVDLINELNDLVNTPAARQMLIYQLNYNPLSQSFSDNNTFHSTFMSDYHAKGLPTQCENIAISNGSSCGTTQFANGAYYVNVIESKRLNWLEKAALAIISPFTLLTNQPKFAMSGLVGLLPNKTTLSAEIRLRALDNMQNQEIYKAQVGIKRKILFFIDVNTYLFNDSYSSGSKYPIDALPGGIYNFADFAGNLPPEYGTYIQQTRFCFVPTVSALDLSIGFSGYAYSDLVYPYQQQNIAVFPKPTPFAAVNIGYQPNEGHISFSSTNSAWLFAKMQGTPLSDCFTGCPYFAHLSITGATSFCNSSNYSVNDATLTWSLVTVAGADGSLSATTGNSITVYGSYPGKAILKATKTLCGIPFEVTKVIYYGAPLKSLLSVRGPHMLTSPNQPGDYGITYDGQNVCGTNNQASLTSLQWDTSPYANNMSEGSMACALDFPYGAGQSIRFGSTGTKYIRVRAQNACGWSEWTDWSSFTVNVSGSGGGGGFNYFYYPNPASSELHVGYATDQKQLADEDLREEPSKLFSAKLYNSNSKVLVEAESSDGSTVQLDVRKIPNGTYYLHMIRGKEIQKKQIIIQH